MKKIIYALIALPIFIICPLGLLICTECPYSDNINPFIPFIIGTIIYYIVIILPLNYLFKKYSNKSKPN